MKSGLAAWQAVLVACRLPGFSRNLEKNMQQKGLMAILFIALISAATVAVVVRMPTMRRLVLGNGAAA